MSSARNPVMGAIGQPQLNITKFQSQGIQLFVNELARIVCNCDDNVVINPTRQAIIIQVLDQIFREQHVQQSANLPSQQPQPQPPPQPPYQPTHRPTRQTTSQSTHQPQRQSARQSSHRHADQTTHQREHRRANNNEQAQKASLDVFRTMGIPVPRILYETKVAKSFGPEMKGNFFGMPKDINTSFYAPDDINEFRTLLPNVDRRAYPKDKSEVKSKSGLKSLFSSSSTPEAAQIPRTDTNGAHSGADARVQDSNQASPSAPNDLQQLSDQVVPSVEEKITSWPFRSGRTNITTTKHTHPPRNIQREGSESDNSSLYSSTLFGTPFLKSGYSQGRDSGYGTQPSARATPANDSQLTASTDSEMDAGDTDLVERKKVPLKPRLQLQDETPRRSSRITALRGEAGVSQPTSSSLGKRTRTSTDEDSCKRSKNQKSDRVSVVTDLRRLREFLFKKVKLIALEDETHSAIPRQLHVPFAEYYIPM